MLVKKYLNCILNYELMGFLFFRYNKVTKRFVFIFNNAFKNFFLKYHLDLLSHNLSKYLSRFPTDWLPFLLFTP